MPVAASPSATGGSRRDPDDAAGTGASPDRAPDTTEPADRGTARQGWLPAVLAVVTVLLGLAIPFAPVDGDDPVVTWPQAGAPATSTALPLTPYRPLSISAEIPCDALRGGTDGLRTEPETAGQPGRGLTVSASGGRVTVTSSGATLLQEVLPLTPCRYTVDANAAGTTVRRDGTVLANWPRLSTPQVAQLATQAPGTPGLHAVVHTDDRYDSVPGGLKTVLLVAHLLALAAVLVLGYRRWRGEPGPGAGLVRPRLHAVDGVLLLVSAGWMLLSPMQNDDSWYLLMARGLGATGYVGNQIYMFNATENPFSASQYLMAGWGALGGWGLLWMRVLSLLMALVTWALLRTLLATTLGRTNRRAWVPWTLLVAHLAWWLPYGMALRPEVFIVPLAAGVMVLCELARRRHAPGALLPATAVAALAVTVSPSGLVAAAPMVVQLPWLWRWLGGRGWRGRIGVVAAVVAAGTIAIPVGFGDATLGDVLEATDIHSWYYVTFPWYEEWQHYRTLIDTGTWGRRLPVLLTVVTLMVVSIGSGRRSPVGGPVRHLMLASAVTTAVALGLLAPGPTKWVNHFGAVAAPATVLLAMCMLSSPLPRRPGALISGASVAVLTGGAVLGFAGPNTWKPYSDRGQLFGNHLDTDITLADLDTFAPHLGLAYPRQLGWWVGLAIVVAAAVAWRRRRHRHTFGLTPERAVLVGACGLLVGLMVWTMVAAPLRQGQGWSLAGSQLQALGGKPCQLANNVTVMTPSTPTLGAPLGPAQLTGDYALAAQSPPRTPTVPPPGPPPGAPGPLNPARWDDQPDLSPAVEPTAASGRGTVTSGWYPIPDRTDATHVVVPVAGNEPEQQRVVLEFGWGPPGAPERTTSVAVAPANGLTERQWQEIPVLLPSGHPTAVRVVAEDQVGGPDSTLAVAPPRLAAMQKVDQTVAGHAVFADQLSAALWPCVNQVAVRDGIAPTPDVRLSAAENTPEFILANPTYEAWGGTLVGSERSWATVRVFSSVGGGPPSLQWGNVDRIVYDHPTHGYDLAVGRTERGGLTRLPTLATEDYSGREYQG